MYAVRGILNVWFIFETERLHVFACIRRFLFGEKMEQRDCIKICLKMISCEVPHFEMLTEANGESTMSKQEFVQTFKTKLRKP